ncbi:MAG: hypothetical protein D6681_18190 [Calditrichaeota bacterium]|nr:MAG: hypothetical protein D6681_18190 [Calditrichota bacterium]
MQRKPIALIPYIFGGGWIALLLLLSNCEHAELPVNPDNRQPQATLSEIQRTIFDVTCAISGCHLGASAPFGLDLSEGKARGNLVNVPSGERPELLRVKPGDPDSSYLVKKIEGAPDILGERMPRGRPPLSAEQIDLIRRWIAEGAKDN